MAISAQDNKFFGVLFFFKGFKWLDSLGKNDYKQSIPDIKNITIKIVENNVYFEYTSAKIVSIATSNTIKAAFLASANESHVFILSNCFSKCSSMLGINHLTSCLKYVSKFSKTFFNVL